MKDVFENAKKHNSFPKSQPKVYCRPEELAEFFENHFNSNDQNFETPEPLKITPDCISALIVNELSINDDPPTLEEIQAVINNLKLNKSFTDIPVEILKCLQNSKLTLQKLLSLYAKIWTTEEIPLQFRHSQITAIWKNKGKKSDPNSYRGIQVSSLLGKIFSIVLINRIKDWCNSQILDMQNEFRQGCDTTDGIHITKTTQLIAEKTNEQIYAIFIDLKAAFDHINSNWLFQSIRNRLPNTNQDNKIINLFDALYQSTTTELKKYPQLNFDINVGVRQGGPESPILFNLYLMY